MATLCQGEDVEIFVLSLNHHLGLALYNCSYYRLITWPLLSTLSNHYIYINHTDNTQLNKVTQLHHKMCFAEWDLNTLHKCANSPALSYTVSCLCSGTECTANNKHDTIRDNGQIHRWNWNRNRPTIGVGTGITNFGSLYSAGLPQYNVKCNSSERLV